MVFQQRSHRYYWGRLMIKIKFSPWPSFFLAMNCRIQSFCVSLFFSVCQYNCGRLFFAPQSCFQFVSDSNTILSEKGVNSAHSNDSSYPLIRARGCSSLVGLPSSVKCFKSSLASSKVVEPLAHSFGPRRLSLEPEPNKPCLLDNIEY